MATTHTTMDELTAVARRYYTEVVYKPLWPTKPDPRSWRQRVWDGLSAAVEAFREEYRPREVIDTDQLRPAFGERVFEARVR